mgnify:CR=1 FL=1
MVSSVAQMLMILAVPSTELALLISVLPLLLAELVELLVLPRADSRFTSCVLVHGMGGTGKTVR